MSLRHALVVDDSRSARVALKKLLEEHQLQVSLASSGEEALEFLARESVDVVFMDHTMPGMDGLEAVTAIKSNPETATIPVMMYTTREGEVYVGQARALGAVGVMPKNVQPHQLFEMLASLGLVKDRRGQPRPEDDNGDRVDQELDRQAMGISLQNVVSRILEDQHMTLRSDILRSQRTFAKQVAKEIVLEQARAEEHDDPHVDRGRSRLGSVFSAMVIVVMAVLVFLTWQFKSQRDVALAELDNRVQTQTAIQDTALDDLQVAVQLTEASVDTMRATAISALSWSLNRETHTAWNEPAFNEQLVDTTVELMGYLDELGFAGAISLASHLGQFCLVADQQGQYQLAPAELSALDCDHIGHPLESSTRVSDRLSVSFARLYQDYGESEPVNLELDALSASESLDVVAYPSSSASAGEWNHAARLNNRVEIRLRAD